MIKLLMMKTCTTILDRKFSDFFHVLAQFPFTVYEMELDHHHEKVNVRVASRVIKQLN